MSFSIITDKRRVVPRWRSFSKTALTGELSTVHDKAKSEIFKHDIFFKTYIASWIDNKCVDTASDIIFYAVSTGCYELAVDQAKYILSNISIAPSELINLSRNIVNELSGNIDIPINENIELDDLRIAIYSEIKNHKSKLIEWPRNAIIWIELARLYTILNEIDKAKKAIHVALQLDGQNRYVVRSAIRYFLHLSDFDEIRKIFNNQLYIYRDPWILASYIALQDKLSKSNLHIKHVRELLDRIDDAQATELAGSLATLEMDNGSIKSAKKLFKRSILMPNDNSLAQAAWAANKIDIFTNIREYHVPYMYEAVTRDSLVNDEYENALRHCMSWMIDEPFSSVPATAGSYIAASFLDKLDCAEQFCQLGLQANPEDKMLLNNYTVILAKSGRLNEAYRAFMRVRSIEEKSPLVVTLLATSGLLFFRTGEISEGRKKYIESISIAKKLNQNDNRAMAAIHFAMEELEYGEISKAEIIKIIDENVTKTEHPNINYLKKKFINQLNRSK